MPAGLKATSSPIAIGFSATELAANTFLQQSTDLNLNPLDREVFVVLSINMDPQPPDAKVGASSAVLASLTTTSQINTVDLRNSNCLASARLDIRSDAAFTEAGAAFTQLSSETPTGFLDYIGIIATNDFFVQIRGSGNNVTKSVAGKLYGYRARATADIYAALVQSEVLSA